MNTLFLLLLILAIILIIAFYFTIVNINYSTHELKINNNEVSQLPPKTVSQDPNCSYGDLPFANVNVNYLLTNC